jgi:hypothetical protein
MAEGRRRQGIGDARDGRKIIELRRYAGIRPRVAGVGYHDGGW